MQKKRIQDLHYSDPFNLPKTKRLWLQGLFSIPQGRSSTVLEMVDHSSFFVWQRNKAILSVSPKLGPLIGCLGISPFQPPPGEGRVGRLSGYPVVGLPVIEPCLNHIWSTDWLQNFRTVVENRGKFDVAAAEASFCLEDIVLFCLADGLEILPEENTDYWRIRNRGFGTHNVPNTPLWWVTQTGPLTLSIGEPQFQTSYHPEKQIWCVKFSPEEGNFHVRFCFG